MRLPNTDKAIIPREKLENYLLSPVHPIGRYKAVFFRSLGYTQDDWEVLDSNLRALLGQDATASEETAYGKKFEIRGSIIGPNGHSAAIITVWIILHGEEVARFVTAYPEE